MSGYDQKAVARLENICAMLASPNDGERATAALMATRMLGQLGLDWREFTRRALAGAKVEQADDDDVMFSIYRDLLKWGGLNFWERKFLGDMLKRKVVNMTDKQEECFARIMRKYSAEVNKKYRAA
jgi:hypothetical protein